MDRLGSKEDGGATDEGVVDGIEADEAPGAGLEGGFISLMEWR